MAFRCARSASTIATAPGTRDKRGTNENVVCIFGDAALTNGISFEAMNNIAHTTKKFIGILNDNEWSIAKNVGAISGYLNKLITHPRYNKLAKDFENFVRKLPKGKLALKLAHKAEEGVKGAISEVGMHQKSEVAFSADGRGGFGNPVLFEELGIRYLGPIDGHNLPLLISTLEFAKTCDHPIVIHILTQKGKGFEAALKFPEKFHGLGPYNAATGETPASKPGTPPAYQDVMGQTMIKLCQQNKNIVGLTAAMPTGTGMKHLEKAMPDRYFDVGIAEERAGLSANDGPTHHGLFDIAYLRCFPNVIAMAPANEDELADMMLTATKQNHPTFIRYPRGTAEGVPVKPEPQLLEVGKAQIVQTFSNNKKRKVALFGLGPMNTLARKAAAQLAAEGYDCAVINPRFTKPIDAAAHETYGHEADLVVTLEDHVLMGGYGSTVLELFSEKGVTTPVVRIGWPDKFIEHASTQDELRKKYGLSVENAVAQVKAHFGEVVADKGLAAARF